MYIDHYHAAEIDNNTLQAIQAIEKQNNIVLVALEKDPSLADLTAEELEMIRQIESRTGKILLAFD